MKVILVVFQVFNRPINDENIYLITPKHLPITKDIMVYLPPG